MKIWDLISVMVLFVFMGILVVLAEPDAKTIKVQPLFIPSPTPVQLDSDKLFSLTNSWRVSESLAPYIKDERLCNLARIRLPEIKTKFTHDMLWKHLNLFTYYGLGENLAENYSSERETLSAWLASFEHLRNLKANFKYSCIATDGSYAVQIFANF